MGASASVVVGTTRPNTEVEHGSSPGPQLKLKLDFVSFSVILKTSGEGAGAKSAITAAAERAHRKNNQKISLPFAFDFSLFFFPFGFLRGETPPYPYSHLIFLTLFFFVCVVFANLF